ncbi:class I SAM-dependent methyltransferase [Myroides pelagicus]|uniref:Methyltransferase domain-containing protein n=1 Tax=Myroides pelagicus TaxID=270914 RepID=A0A7K1GGY1_9FLAO|nr:class I SAM-dependent methyltransferase [Myroides pelagicus]MEC4113490.1 methyltransferase domain-containing protein [Myroides pelagicus]MTH28327.1 methyltransferase domain-containing protein [Myroides pelagicus]
MSTKYTTQDRGDKKQYQQYLEAMDAIAIEKVASASVFFHSKQGNVLVDVGMASGTSTAILAELFPHLQVIGVDINPKMVNIAQKTYQLPNLSFREDDGETLTSFTENKVSGFFNCSAIHHITSYNDYDNNRALNTLKRQVELLQDKGVLVVRDFVKVEEKEVILELSTLAKEDRPSDTDLFIQFSQTARCLSTNKGFPIEEVQTLKSNTKRFKAFYTDVVEFIRRKDYYANWDIELQEEYGYFTQKEFEDTFRDLGLRIIVSTPIYNQWIINNRYKGAFTIYDLEGNDIGLPPTNYLIAGEKVTGAKQLQLTRHLPLLSTPYLEYSSFLNVKNKQVFDLVKRPNQVVDILPYQWIENNLKVIAKHGYPRPLCILTESGQILDGKRYSGYIPEALALADSADWAEEVAQRFNIMAKHYLAAEQGLSYYTSPGGINERVVAQYLPLTDNFNFKPSGLPKARTGFKDMGCLKQYDAIQLLNTAQTGALVEARLELNIYYLLAQKKVELPKWLGEQLTPEQIDDLSVTNLSDILDQRAKEYIPTAETVNFLTTRRAVFAERGIDNSNVVLEYTYPTNYSINTVTVLPVYKYNQEVYIGLEQRSLPVPQLHQDNSLLLTIPAFRLSKKIEDLWDLEQYLEKLIVEGSPIKAFKTLGQKYFPSIGVTPEQVYPYVVTLAKASEHLHWVKLDELIDNIDKLTDAHLLIALFRFIHSQRKH